MTSEEILSTSWASDERQWLREIAYQLAKMNEGRGIHLEGGEERAEMQKSREEKRIKRESLAPLTTT